MAHERRYAVAGGGMAGMYYAAELKRLDPAAEVHLIESSPALGGTYGSIRYENDRIFDYGMHLFYEACDERVDRVLREVLAEDEWFFWEGNRKDVGGLFWRGRLQTGSHYVDLRDGACKPEFVADLFDSLGQAPAWEQAEDCAGYFTSKFGKALTEQVLRPVQRKLWHADPEELDPLAIKMVSADRVVLYDHDLMLDLMKSEALRCRLAVPDQMRLPSSARSTRQRALYPRRYGFCHYVDRFAERLKNAGVIVHLGTQVKDLAPSDGAKLKLRAQGRNGDAADLDVHHAFWAAPLIQLAQVLKVPFDDLPMDIPHHIGYVHWVLDRPPKMGDLYYFYCYDQPFRTFRVTNFAAFCPGSEQDGYAICAEIHYPGNDRLPEKREVIAAATAELSSMGIIDASHRVGFVDAHLSRFGFPRPTRRNTRAFGAIRTRIAERIPRGLSLGGVAPDLGRFFLHDVLVAAADQLASPRP